MSGSQTPQDELDAPLEKAHKVQVAHDQHHRKEQHNGGKVDEMQRRARRHNAERYHGHRADDRRPRPVDLESRKFSQGKDEITCDENRVRRNQVDVRERQCTQGIHPLARISGVIGAGKSAQTRLDTSKLSLEWQGSASRTGIIMYNRVKLCSVDSLR